MVTVCLGVISLTSIIGAPQSDEKRLCRFSIVWSHLLKYQKCGVQPVLLIYPHALWDVIYNLSNVIDQREYHFDCQRVVNGHTWMFFILPRVMVILEIFPCSSPMPAIMLDKMLETT